MCIFHKWGKWEQFDKEILSRQISETWVISGFTEHWQRRTCAKCGKVKQKLYGSTIR